MPLAFNEEDDVNIAKQCARLGLPIAYPISLLAEAYKKDSKTRSDRLSKGASNMEPSPEKVVPATLIPGDGIGPEIIGSTLKVLEALGSPQSRYGRGG